MSNYTDSKWVGTPLEAFGGPVPCESIEDCLYSVDNVSLYASRCQSYKNSTVYDFKEGYYCSCDPAFGKLGPACMTISFDAYWNTIVLVIITVVGSVLLGYQLFTLARAKYHHLLKLNPATTTLLFCTFSVFLNVAWLITRILMYTNNATDTIGQWGLYLAGFTGSFCGITMSLVILVWNQVLASSKKLKKNSGGINKMEKMYVFLASGTMFTATMICFFVLENYGLAMLLNTGYFIILAALYIYKGKKLKKLVDEISGNNQDKVAKIISCIRGCIKFIVLFVLAGGLYTFTNKGVNRADFEISVLAVQGLAGCHLLAFYLGMTITNYAMGPLKQRISVAATSVAPTSEG